MYSSFYGRMPLKLGAAWLWICIQMNTEQIIQSTDPSLRLLRLHPSCSVFTVSPRSKSDPKPSCAFVWAQPIKCAHERGTVGSCSVWEKQKRLLCREKTCKNLYCFDSTVIKVFNRLSCSQHSISYITFGNLRAFFFVKRDVLRLI